jgi:hypothetical protein
LAGKFTDKSYNENHQGAPIFSVWALLSIYNSAGAFDWAALSYSGIYSSSLMIKADLATFLAFL